MPMGKWMQKEAQVVAMLAIHEATAIVDERKCPLCKTREYLVKWKASCSHFFAASLRPLIF